MMHTSTPRFRWLVLAAAAVAAACEGAPPTGIAAPSDPALARRVTAPDLPPPEQFVEVVSNPYFPLIPGTTYRYRSETDEGVESNTVEVTHEVRSILGIDATVVHDRVYLDDELAEDTYDWYAQDREGNVWYLGEDSCEVEDGQCVSTEGSWEAGKDVAGIGSVARAGIIMWGDPGAHRGKSYRQEYYEGEAEDMAKVLRLDAAATVPYGRFRGCLETMDFTPLEPGVREVKIYCPDTGLVLEIQPQGGRVRVELVAISGEG